MVAGVAWFLARRPAATSPAVRAGQSSIAVLPFQSLGSDKSADFLRLALPDEIVTTLSRVPSLAIRPFAATRKYDKPDADPQAAGKELGVFTTFRGGIWPHRLSSIAPRVMFRMGNQVLHIFSLMRPADDFCRKATWPSY